MIPFNKPPCTGNEEQYVLSAMRSDKMSGDGEFGLKCQIWFERYFKCPKTMLTPSCTQALEMAALLIGVQPGDEVIMPSYTFVSTANAFALRGAKIVFVDIRPDTMNLDENLIEFAITDRTRAIVPMHYAGVACDMDPIMDIADRHGLFVIEDAAQGLAASYKERPLGSIGHLGALSFHETKNCTSGGEGGLLIINDASLVEQAEIIREKGTNRNQFFRGMVDKYTWIDIGSSYLPSELQSAYLWGQLEEINNITTNRLEIWNNYCENLRSLDLSGIIDIPTVPDFVGHNGHIFYIKVKDISQRMKLIAYLNKNGVNAVFHYVPLHSSIAGKKFGKFFGTERFTTSESDRLIRLPLWYGMDDQQVKKVIGTVVSFWGSPH